tara:strand:+ start:654 stop:848 length:195 start_codon:yes stop_codon:yes gene_type:complete
MTYKRENVNYKVGQVWVDPQTGDSLEITGREDILLDTKKIQERKDKNICNISSWVNSHEAILKK